MAFNRWWNKVNIKSNQRKCFTSISLASSSPMGPVIMCLVSYSNSPCKLQHNCTSSPTLLYTCHKLTDIGTCCPPAE